MSSVSWFLDEDDLYLAWVARHSHGYVLNCEREPRPPYLVLHRASCWTVSGTPAHGTNWTSTYGKACALARAELERWAQERTGGVPKPCGLCQP
jgi:hypothetical protein